MITNRPDLGRRAGAVALAMAAVVVFYMATNRWQWRPPSLLPLSVLDLGPARPWAIPFYFSHYVFLPLSLLALRREDVFERTLRAMVIAAALSDAIFFFYPTTILRSDAPGALFALLRGLDAPTNCFPSQHVALACVGAWGLWEDRLSWAPLGAAWVAAICVSTVLTKQHYAVDVPSGALLAALSVLLSRRPRRERALGPDKRARQEALFKAS